MVKRILAHATVSGLLLLGGCSQDNVTAPVSPDVHNENAVMSRQTAMAVAQDEIANMRTQGDACGWSAEARVTDAFVVYGTTIDNPAYFECKVTDVGGDAGYVLVTANKTDILIPESSPEGKTLTEYYRALVQDTDMRVVRYDWVRSAAVSSEGKVLAFQGFDNDFPEDQGVTADQVNSLVQTTMVPAYAKAGVFPLYTKDQLASTYAESENGQALAKSAGSWRDIYSSLRYTFPDGNHTPQWTQFAYEGCPPIGCGPTAWAILYAYWKQFKGKTGLFYGLDLTYRYTFDCSGNAEIWGCMTSTASYMGTILDPDFGLTWTWDMQKGIQYAKQLGYSFSSVVRDRGSEYLKFDKVNSYISADKPCLLAMGLNSAAANHYSVIEKCKKSQYKYAWIWHDRNVYYYVNMGGIFGGSAPHKWICVKDFFADQNAITSAFSVYMVDVQ